ncbi:MAG: NnrS family protein [Pseudomonadota bacterium]
MPRQASDARQQRAGSRLQPWHGAPLWRNGFRPFFLGGAVWAAGALAVFVLMLQGAVAVPSTFSPLHWHGHEMLFGYAAAVIAGFVLTAVPNWTGRLPLKGVPLIMLFVLWLTGRAAVACSAIVGPWPTLAVDVGFLATMMALVLREIVAGRNWRNLPIAAALGMLAFANLLTHLDPAAGLDTLGLGLRLGLATVLILIGLVGGRVVPSFTRNWLVKLSVPSLPAPFDRFDKLALAVIVAALLTWSLSPDSIAAGSLLMAAGLVHAIRLCRWRGWQTGSEPLVLILHLGYAWLPVGLFLLGLEILGLGPALAAQHALTAGAIGTMTLAIMSRASLGHTGRKLSASPATVMIYLPVISGALMRVIAPALPIDYSTSLPIAALLWGGAFAMFAIVYGPLLLGRRSRLAAVAG